MSRRPAGNPEGVSRGRFSELECFVLGLVWQNGPCSPYEVRRRMADSPSTQWSGSAGAIYPLMRKLERLGLLQGRAERTGNRRRREYGLTGRGRGALRDWIGPPLPKEAVSVGYDPLRSRARFLWALTPERRRRWLRDAEAALEEVERRVRRWQKTYGGNADPMLALITRHGELEVAFRRAWLQELGATL